MKLNFAQDVLVLPATVLDVATDADAEQLRVLLQLSSDLSLADTPQKLAKLVGCTTERARAAIAFWQERGILAADVGEAPAVADTPKETPKSRVTMRVAKRAAEALPAYSTTEIADLLEAREGMRILVDEAQNILGRIFTPADLNALVCMVDYLQMDEACILLLLAHCKRIGKTQLRSIERYAISLSDKGINDPAALDEYIRDVEMLHSLEGIVRTMFGLKSRSMTEKEKRMLKAWMEYGYGEEVVRRAYERTVNATGDASIPYANAILERWHGEGLTTPEEIDAAIAAENEKKSGAAVTVGSFDSDDFFEAALERSFRESEKL